MSIQGSLQASDRFALLGLIKFIEAVGFGTMRSCRILMQGVVLVDRFPQNLTQQMCVKAALPILSRRCNSFQKIAWLFLDGPAP